MKKEKITVICYGEEKIWDNREKAKEFYLEAMMNTEGSEKERYSNIFGDLCSGLTTCRDE